MGHGTSEHLSSPPIRSSLQSCNTARKLANGEQQELFQRNEKDYSLEQIKAYVEGKLEEWSFLSNF